MQAADGKAFIDGWGGRVVAALVLACVAAALLALHWDDLFPPDDAVAAADPLSVCVAQRQAEIDKMIAEAPAMAARREVLLERLPGLCMSQLGIEGGGQPPAPGVPRP